MSNDILAKLIKADSVEAAAQILADTGYELTASDSEQSTPSDMDEGAGDETVDEPGKPKGGSFGFLRDKMAEKF